MSHLIEATPEDTHTDVHDMQIDNEIMPIRDERVRARVEGSRHEAGGRRRGPGGVAVTTARSVPFGNEAATVNVLDRGKRYPDLHRAFRRA